MIEYIQNQGISENRMYDKSIAIVMNMMKHPDTFPYIVL